MEKDEAERRIEAALDVLYMSGGVEGDHHKAWVIDQVVRHLTGCHMEPGFTGLDARGNPYSFEALGTSDEYEAWVTKYQDGEDGPLTYMWDNGIAP